MKNEINNVNRRGFMQTGVMAAGLVAGGVFTGTKAEGAVSKGKTHGKHVLRIAHMTDIHVQPERGAKQGLIAALEHVQNLKDKPDLIVTGGDTIMDCFAKDADRTALQWELFKKVMKDHCSLPVRSCIGNHDVWGWNKKSSGTSGRELLWGKKRAVHELQLPGRYYSFEQAGWHIIVLDSTHHDPDDKNGYIARLDDEQYVWLSEDLKKTDAKKPVMVVTHQPILSAASFFDGDNEKKGDWYVPAAWMHIDARRIKDLFKKHPNVKLCLSGHLHLIDRVDYCGVSYFCNGAVSGAWWAGNNQECDEGYGLVDLYADGSFENQYVSYGWKPIV